MIATRRVLAALAPWIVLAAALPPAAAAGTVAQEGVVEAPVLEFRALRGEVNDLSVNGLGAPIAFRDAGAPLAAGRGCASADAAEVLCAVEGGSWPRIEVHAGDQGDRAVVRTLGGVLIWGGAGDDHVSGDSFGGPVVVRGGRGDDEVTATGEGGQTSVGGVGDDVLHTGGTAGSTTGLGGPGDDAIDFRIAIAGLPSLDGGAGDDTIVAQPHGLATAVGTLLGGPGDDALVVRGLGPDHREELGRYDLAGGAGDDTLGGGVDADAVDGGPGRDRIDVAGGGADVVSCGTGHDAVRFDGADAVAGDCEDLELVR